MNGKRLTVLLDTVVLATDVLTDCGSNTPEITVAGTAALATEAGTDAGSSTVSGDTRDTEAAKAENTPSADLNSTISVVGSTPMEKFANAFSESFMERHPGIAVTAEFVGPDAGVEAISNGIADIGNLSRGLKDEEKTDGMAENTVAIDGIAMVVDTANTAEDPIKQQLSDIYEGKIANRKDVGGNDALIIVVGRESGPGTRSALEELLKPEDACKYSDELDSTGAVTIKVAPTSGAIGYVPLDVLDDTIKAVKLEGVESTEENTKVGSYFLSRPFIMATKGEISEWNDLVKILFDYVYSEKGVETVRSVGPTAVDK